MESTLIYQYTVAMEVTKAKLVGKELEVVGKELEVKRVVMLKARKKRPGKESEKEKLRKKPSWQD